MNMKTVEDVFIHLLSDTYSAEKQLTRALSKLARRRVQREAERRVHGSPRRDAGTDRTYRSDY